MNIGKSCVNYGAKNYMKVDHRGYRRNFWSCEKKARKKFRLVRDSNPRPPSHLGAGRWIGCVHTVDEEAELLIELIPLRFRLSPYVRAALYLITATRLPFNWCCNDFGGLFPLPRLHTMNHCNHLVVFWTSILLLPCTLLEKCPPTPPLSQH